MTNRLVIGISGSSGVIFGIRMLEVLKDNPKIETHLVLSRGARTTLSLETKYKVPEVTSMASVNHEPENLAASISSGSFQTLGMVVVPCSMKSLAQIALALSDNLLTRAADVTLKERRKLVIVPRETPLNLSHLKHMVSITEMGGVILPPAPSFYHNPNSVTDLIDQTIGKVLDQFHIEHNLFDRWKGHAS
jgi:flavin prenyltransferase